MKIIVDAMGGDNAPVSNVRGALAAVRELGVEVILVGRGEDISRRTASANCPRGWRLSTPPRWWRCATTRPPPLRRRRTPP